MTTIAQRPKVAGRFRNQETCRAKRRYRDHEEAIAALHKTQAQAHFDLEETGFTRRGECRSYFCCDCCGWHLTSQPSRIDVLMQEMSRREAAGTFGSLLTAPALAAA